MGLCMQSALENDFNIQTIIVLIYIYIDGFIQISFHLLDKGLTPPFLSKVGL